MPTNRYRPSIERQPSEPSVFLLRRRPPRKLVFETDYVGGGIKFFDRRYSEPLSQAQRNSSR